MLWRKNDGRVQQTKVPAESGRRPLPWNWAWIILGWMLVMTLAGGLYMAIAFPGDFQRLLRKEMIIQPGTKAYQAWKKSSIPTVTRIYMFSVLNPKEVTRGMKPHLKQMGPYSFREVMERVDDVFHPNGTVSFKTKRTWVFLSEESSSLDEEVTSLDMPQFAAGESVRGQYQQESVMKFMFAFRTSIFATHTVREWLFDGITDFFMTTGSMLAKTSAPMDKFGWFYKKNGTTWSDGVLNMDTGLNQYEDVGEIREWKFSKRTKYPGHCGKVRGTSGFLSHNANRQYIDYFSTDICRPIRFEREDTDLEYQGLPTTKFSLRPSSTFGNATTNPENACYHPNLPSGVHNATGCQDEGILPIFISMPHFLGADPSFRQKLTPNSLKPSQEEHEAGIYLHSGTSIPVRLDIRLQINLQLRKNPNLGGNWDDLPDAFLPILWFSSEARTEEDAVGQLQFLARFPAIVRIVGIVMVVAVCATLIIVLTRRYRNTSRSYEMAPVGPNAS